MTLESTIVKVSYAGDNSTVSFPTTFIYWDDTDIEVILRTDATGAETTWVDGTQYTLSGGDGLTGTLTVDTSPTDYTPATGETLVIRSNREDTQPTDFPLGGSFPSTSAERSNDQQVRLTQQHTEELSRTIKVSKTSPLSDIILPEPVATNLLAWNGAEDGFVNAVPTEGSVLLDEDDMASNSSAQGSTQQSIRSFGSGISGLVALRALSPLSGESRFIKYRTTLNDGGYGDFVFDSSDLTSEITADTESGVYVAPNSDITGASGAWVRQYSGQASARWFGGDLAALVAAYGSTEITVQIDQEIIIPDGISITIPYTMGLLFARGGSVDGVSGGGTETLTINGAIVANSYQKIFGANLTVAGIPLTEEISPLWWQENTTPGTTDFSTAFQAAIDLAQGSTNGEQRIVKWPSGVYGLSSEITIKSSPIIGTIQAAKDTRLIWNGATNTTVLNKWSTSHSGNNTYVWIEQIDFRAGVNEPDTWIDFTLNTGAVDIFHRLRELRFGLCTDSAIKLGRWVNCHWEHLRFDGWGEYAIEIIVPTGGSNLSSFTLDKFTADHNKSGGTAKGFLAINSIETIANEGVLEIANGRIEINEALAADNPAVLVELLDGSPAGSRLHGFLLRNIVLQVSAGSCYWYSVDNPGANYAPSLFLLNSRGDSVTGMTEGILTANWNDATMPGNMPLWIQNQGTGAGTGQDATIGETLFAPYSTGSAWRFRNPGDTYDRVALDTNGKFQLGGGGGAADTTLYRDAANRLKTDDLFVATIGLGVGNSAANVATPSGATTKQLEIFDDSGNSLGYIPIYAAPWT